FFSPSETRFSEFSIRLQPPVAGARTLSQAPTVSQAVGSRLHNQPHPPSSIQPVAVRSTTCCCSHSQPLSQAHCLFFLHHMATVDLVLSPTAHPRQDALHGIRICSGEFLPALNPSAQLLCSTTIYLGLPAFNPTPLDNCRPPRFPQPCLVQQTLDSSLPCFDPNSTLPNITCPSLLLQQPHTASYSRCPNRLTQTLGTAQRFPPPTLPPSPPPPPCPIYLVNIVQEIVAHSSSSILITGME
ncbi:hypothetical protein BKA81DRAFT_354276, partial [Phyllosticta paracitricarpa]